MDIPVSESVLSFSAPFNWALSFRVIESERVVTDTNCTPDQLSRYNSRVRTPVFTYDGNNNNEQVYCRHIPSDDDHDVVTAAAITRR